MIISLKTNEVSVDKGAIPFFIDWEEVEMWGKVPNSMNFVEDTNIEAILFYGKDGESENDYFVYVELGDLKPSTDPEAMEGEMEFVSTGERVWVHHSFIYNLDGSKLHI